MMVPLDMAGMMHRLGAGSSVPASFWGALRSTPSLQVRPLSSPRRDCLLIVSYRVACGCGGCRA